MDTEMLLRKIREKKVRISVFGLGRIGLPTALKIASGGFRVIGVDIDEALLEDLKNSLCFTDEPGLVELLKRVNEACTIEYTGDLEYAVQSSDVIIICLPTPVDDNKVPNYNAIENNAKLVGGHLRKNQLFIMESSVSPTTLERTIIPILERESSFKVNRDFGVCSCPERADPGRIVANFDSVPRIIGGTSKEVVSVAASLYKSVTGAEINIVSTPGTANAVKLTENIFRDVNIALMNEFAILYEKLGIDIKEVIAGCSTKYNFVPHYPGPGVGGPCLPANPYYIIKDASRVDFIPFLIRVAREVNDRMPEHVRDSVIRALNRGGLCVRGTTISVLGISYKAGVRDIQISPALKVVSLLREMGANLRVFDPFYRGEVVEDLEIYKTLGESLDGTRAVVVLTDHPDFRLIDFRDLGKRMKPLIVVDSRNMYNLNDFPAGTIYYGVGRPLQEIGSEEHG
ncbi:MAG: nucleotide sugar dehydrogenase [Promethearchaeota archaeon]